MITIQVNEYKYHERSIDIVEKMQFNVIFEQMND